MAEKRMFSKTITDRDDFLSMPPTSQNLYFHLGLHADDDGFVDSPRRVMNCVGAREDDMKILITKQYIIPFESGVCVVKHWRMHNYLRADRYKPTAYREEMSKLSVLQSGEYVDGCTLGIPSGNQVDTNGMRRVVESSIKESSVSRGEFAANDDLLQNAQQLNNVFDAAHHAGFPDNAATMDALNLLTADYGTEAVIRAIGGCVDQSVIKLSYLKGILKSDPTGGAKPKEEAYTPKPHWEDES